jgi:hypothetical protein
MLLHPPARRDRQDGQESLSSERLVIGRENLSSGCSSPTRSQERDNLGSMGKLLFFVSIGTALVGSFAIAACVGDEPSPATSGTVAQGVLGGPCFANGTCNAGLSCNVVEGTAKCAASTGAPPADAAPVDPPSNLGTEDASSSGLLVCKFQTTPFPCGGQQPPNVCYGATQSCTLTGCGGDELAWQCNSANQCGTACCVPTDAATLSAGAGCTEGTLLITAGAASGATCSSATACPAGAIQLCQANSGCPSGQRCAPVKIIGAGAAFNGTIVAACVP